MNQHDVSLHAAFFMEGLHDVGYSAVINSYSHNGGCIDVVSDLVAYAPTAEQMVQKSLPVVNGGFPGVFDYEVSGPFGKWFGQFVLDNGEIPPKDMGNRKLAKEVLDFFSQGGEGPEIRGRLAEELKICPLLNGDRVRILSGRLAGKCGLVEESGDGAHVVAVELGGPRLASERVTLNEIEIKPIGMLLDEQPATNPVEFTHFDEWGLTWSDVAWDDPRVVAATQGVLLGWSAVLDIPEIAPREGFVKRYISAGCHSGGYPGIFAGVIEKIIEAGFSVYASDAMIEIYRQQDIRRDVLLSSPVAAGMMPA